MKVLADYLAENGIRNTYSKPWGAQEKYQHCVIFSSMRIRKNTQGFFKNTEKRH